MKKKRVKREKITSVFSFSAKEVEEALLSLCGISKDSIKSVKINALTKEDTSDWSGQVWDDGPLPQYFNGIKITVEEKT